MPAIHSDATSSGSTPNLSALGCQVVPLRKSQSPTPPSVKNGSPSRSSVTTMPTVTSTETRAAAPRSSRVACSRGRRRLLRRPAGPGDDGGPAVVIAAAYAPTFAMDSSSAACGAGTNCWSLDSEIAFVR
jgi:hypothetical protein